MQTHINYLQNDWVIWLLIRKFIYNNNVYVSIKITSFFVNKKYYFKLNVILKSALINISAVSKRAEQMINIYIIIKKCWQDTIEQQIKYFNTKIKFMIYSVKDMMWLNRKNICNIQLNKKLKFKFHSLY